MAYSPTYLSVNFRTGPFADVPSVVATKYVILDNLLQTTKITSFPATCYKTKVWTDFRVRVRIEIRYSSSYIISL